jgi:hypothetical protein
MNGLVQLHVEVEPSHRCILAEEFSPLSSKERKDNERGDIKKTARSALQQQQAKHPKIKTINLEE